MVSEATGPAGKRKTRRPVIEFLPVFDLPITYSLTEKPQDGNRQTSERV